MANNENSPWKKPFSAVVDQRQEKMPSAWLAAGPLVSERCERGHEVFGSGPQRVAADAVVALVRLAVHKVVVSSFLLADRDIEDALLAAGKQGVRVYVLLASEARLGKAERDGEFDKRVLEEHKKMLSRLAGYVLFRSAQHFHAKVVLVDPETRPAGVLLTANLTKEALERNEELTVVLTSEEVVEATETVKWAMWESAEHEFMDPADRFKSVKPLGKVAHPGLSSAVVATTPKSASIRDEALRLIKGAQSRIVVSSFGWGAGHEVVRALAERARAGIDVTVLARVRPVSMPALLDLASAGAKVVGFTWLHAKAVWTDSGHAMVMSANLEAIGLDGGFELGVRLSGSRADEVGFFLTRWAEQRAEWRLVVAPVLGDASGKVKLWHGCKLEESEIQPRVDVELDIVAAKSAEDLTADMPVVPSSGPFPRLAHELRCRWVVVAPVLAANAKEVKRPVEKGEKAVSYTPPVFREPGGRLVVAVRDPDELDSAREIMHLANAEAIVLAADGV